jgi:tRNA-dihydrouridine synthase C
MTIVSSEWTFENGRPKLFLAPMEGVGDSSLRQAITTIGGFDEACTEFIRVPKNAHVKSLAKSYRSNELDPIPLAAQLMGDDPRLMADMAREIESRGAPRIDLNCGCPSNVVVGRGAGASLLKDPEQLYSLASCLVKACSVPVTAKLRSGFEDISLFKENILAAESAGVSYITLHPRTKVERYTPPARWDLIAEAKSLLKIPVVGSGDVVDVSTALAMLKQTGCDGVMIGRGALKDPWVFRDIKAHFAGEVSPRNWNETLHYLDFYAEMNATRLNRKGQVNKLKQLINYLLEGSESRRPLLRTGGTESGILLKGMKLALREEKRWKSC